MHRPTLGILAGMGPASTGPFIELVVAECRTQYGAHDDVDFPKMVIVSQPAPFFHDRDVDHDAVEAATIEGLRHLEKAGADVIAIACNSVHMYFPRLTRSVSVPLLNIVAEAFDALPAETRTVAIAASRPLAESGLYQDAAARRGLNVVEPNWQPQIDALQEMVKAETDPAAFAATWTRLFRCLDEVGEVDAVIVACLDVSGVLRHADPHLPVVDAARALAARLVKDWLDGRKARQTSIMIDTGQGRFEISSDVSRLDIDAVHAFLTRSYWAEGIPRHLVAESISRSLCFGLYDEAGAQAGFARLITDHATFAYLADVYVLDEYRGQGLGKALVEAVTAHPAFTTVRRALLATRDAHGLYLSRGFTPLRAPETFMEISRPGIYRIGPSRSVSSSPKRNKSTM